MPGKQPATTEEAWAELWQVVRRRAPVERAQPRDAVSIVAFGEFMRTRGYRQLFRTNWSPPLLVVRMEQLRLVRVVPVRFKPGYRELHVVWNRGVRAAVEAAWAESMLTGLCDVDWLLSQTIVHCAAAQRGAASEAR